MTNTNKQTISTAAAVEACRQKLNEVALQRRNWETSDEHDRSTKGLLSVLANCLGIYFTEYKNSSLDEQAAMRKDWSETLKDKNIGVQKNTRPLAMIVKLTFETDRKLASKYATVLQIAAENMQSKDTFADWAKKEGGLEEISRSKNANLDAQVEKEKKLEKVISEINAAEISPLATVSLNACINIGRKGLLIAIPTPGEKANIIGVLPNLSDALMRRIYAEISKNSVNSKSKEMSAEPSSSSTEDGKVIPIEEIAKMLKRSENAHPGSDNSQP